MTKNIFFESRWRLGNRLIWLVWGSLGLCLIYSLFYSAGYLGVSFFVLSNRSMVEYTVSRSLASATWDLAAWSGAIFVILACLFYSLISGKANGFHRFWIGTFLIILVALNCLVLFGILSISFLILISVTLLALSLILSFDFFGTSRFRLLRGLLFGSIFVALFVEAAALILFNLPYTLNVPAASSAVAVHWRLAELSLSNLAYPLLPYAYLLLISLGVIAFLVKVAPAVSLSTNERSRGLLPIWARFRRAIESCKEKTCEPSSARFPLSVAIMVSCVVSCLFVVVTVLPWINPTYRLVSVDAPVLSVANPYEGTRFLFCSKICIYQ